MDLIKLATELQEKRAKHIEFVKEISAGETIDEGKVKEAEDQSAEIETLQTKYSKYAALENSRESAEAAMQEATKVLNPLARGAVNINDDDPMAAAFFATKNIKLISLTPERFAQKIADDIAAAKYQPKQSQNYKATYDGINTKGLFRTKTLVDTTLFPPFSPRTAEIVEYPLTIPTVPDLIPQDMTPFSEAVWMEQTVSTRNAAPTAEGTAPTANAYTWVERRTPLQRIAGYIPLTNQVVKYSPFLANEIQTLLYSDIEIVAENQIVNGNGVSPNLHGFIESGVIPAGNVYNAAGVNVFLALAHGMTLVSTSGVIGAIGSNATTGIVMSAAMWELISTAQDAVDNFILGSPASIAAKVIWGVPVVISGAIADNVVLMGDFLRRAHISLGSEVEIEVGRINDGLITGEQVIVAAKYESLEIKRPSAFVKITNFGS